MQASQTYIAKGYRAFVTLWRATNGASLELGTRSAPDRRGLPRSDGNHCASRYGRTCSDWPPSSTARVTLNTLNGRGSLRQLRSTESSLESRWRSVDPKRVCRLNRGGSVRWNRGGHHRHHEQHQADGDEHDRIVQISDRPLGNN